MCQSFTFSFVLDFSLLAGRKSGCGRRRVVASVQPCCMGSVCVCGGGRAERVHRVSSQKEGKLGAREKRAVPLSYPTSGPARGHVSCVGVRPGEKGYTWSVQRFHTELWPHIKAWQHELILGFLKPDAFLPREVRQPQSLAPRTATSLPGAPWGRQGLHFLAGAADPGGTALIGSQGAGGGVCTA